MINIPQLSMSFAAIEGKIVDVNVGPNQVVRQRFSRHNFHLGSYFKIGLLFIDLTWLVTVKSLFLARSMWNHVIFCMSSHN